MEQKVQALARDSNEHGTMIHALKGMHKTFDKCFAEIGHLESHVRIELQKFNDKIEMTEASIAQQQIQNLAMERQHRADMLSVVAAEKHTELAVQQMEDHKKRVAERLEEAIQKWNVQVAELEAPQSHMKATLETNNTLLQQCIQETGARIIQCNVIDKRLQKAEVKLAVMEQTKLNSSELEKLVHRTNKTFEQLDVTWKR